MTDSIQVKFPVGSAVKHVKSEGVYIITLTPDRGMLEATGERAYSYTNGTTVFHRCQSEMEDGRFIPHIQPSHPISH